MSMNRSGKPVHGTFVRRQHGVGMVEILVALLVMSIGLLGYAGLQLRALGSTEDAHYRTQAIAIAQDLAERVAANPQALSVYTTAANWAALAGDGDSRTMPASWNTCTQAACTAASMADSDILHARWQARWLLPNGRVAAAECVADGAVCVTVSWRDADPAACTPPDDDCVRLEVVSWQTP